MSTTPPPALLPPQTHPPHPVGRARPHAAVATTWGLVAGGLAVAPVAAGGYLLQPTDTEGFEGLGWIIGAFALGVLVYLVAGAAAITVGLRSAGCRHAGRTALVFVPVALLAGALTMGAGALAAPALAHWVVGGFVGRRQGAAASGPRWGGLPQRVVVAVTGSVLVAAVVLARLPHGLAGERHGGLVLWALTSAAAAVPLVALLARRVPVLALLAAVTVAAALVVVPVRQDVATAHPSPERLADLVDALDVPAGVSVSGRASAADEGWAEFSELTTLTLATAPSGAAPVTIPEALRPDARGYLPEDADASVPPATDSGRRTAAAWEQSLRDAGWVADTEDSGWISLTTPVRTVLAGGGPVYESGLWIRGQVVPTGDGALVVVTVRP